MNATDPWGIKIWILYYALIILFLYIFILAAIEFIKLFIEKLKSSRKKFVLWKIELIKLYRDTEQKNQNSIKTIILFANKIFRKLFNKIKQSVKDELKKNFIID